MRNSFVKELIKQMEINPYIVFLTGDLGFNVVEPIKDKFPHRFINCGASEMAMMDVAVGLALSDKIPFVYSITPFLLYRPFEAIRLYLAHENIPVKLVGSGRDKDYGGLGFSHWSEEDNDVMKLFPNIKCFYPNTKEQITNMVKEMIENEAPSYINLSKK